MELFAMAVVVRWVSAPLFYIGQTPVTLGGLGSAVLVFIAALFVYLLGDVDGLRAQYVAAAVLTLLILAHGFVACRSRCFGIAPSALLALRQNPLRLDPVLIEFRP